MQQILCLPSFLKEKQHVYFQLSKMSKACFVIPVTNALDEYFFNKPGFILRLYLLSLYAIHLPVNLFYAKQNINFLIEM
jgi:hypothetical protein